jgi:hypothetical protein
VRPALLALLLCALVAGCGSDVDERNAYVAAVNEARVGFDRQVAVITGRLRETSTPARTRRALRDLEAAATSFSTRLRAVQPPPVVATEHDRLVQQVERYGAEFDRAQDAFRTEDPNRYLEARTELQRDVASAGERLNAVIDELNAQLRKQ